MFYAVAKVFKLGDGTHSRKQKVLEREALGQVVGCQTHRMFSIAIAQLTGCSALITIDARGTRRETRLEGVLKILLPAGGRVLNDPAMIKAKCMRTLGHPVLVAGLVEQRAGLAWNCTIQILAEWLEQQSQTSFFPPHIDELRRSWVHDEA